MGKWAFAHGLRRLESGSPLYLLPPAQSYAPSPAKGCRCYPSHRKIALLFVYQQFVKKNYLKLLKTTQS